MQSTLFLAKPKHAGESVAEVFGHHARQYEPRHCACVRCLNGMPHNPPQEPR